MRWLRVLLGLTIVASAVLLLLLGGGILWLTAGDLLTNVRDYAGLAAMLLQALVLLCMVYMAACQAEGRRAWGLFLLMEALTTALSAALGINWQKPGGELLLTLLPLMCAAVLTGLSAWLRALPRPK